MVKDEDRNILILTSIPTKSQLKIYILSVNFFILMFHQELV